MEANEDRISQVFEGQHVLITGVTGFMGKVFFERILRCTQVAKIYLLLRPKNGIGTKFRLKNIFKNSLFDTLKSIKNIDKIIDNKIQIINGDCSQLSLDISENDRNLICENVTFIYHFAATTRFDESLKFSMDLNVRGTFELLKIARDCQKLKFFCHISTAYCHLEEKILEEKFYPPPFDPQEMMEVVTKPYEVNKFLSPTIPNTYVLTKALAESLVEEAQEKFNLPIMILRPSIVTPTAEDPIAGWMNNYSNIGGVIIAAGKGLLRTFYCNSKFNGDFIPVDIATNLLMLLTWRFIDKKSNLMIVNATTSDELVFKWGEMLEKALKNVIEFYPMTPMLWYPNLTLVHHKWLHILQTIYLHWLPALIGDCLLACCGKKTFLIKTHKELSRGLKAIEKFTTNQWYFESKVNKELRLIMNSLEKEKYNISSDSFDVDEYIKNLILGSHKFLLKRENLDFSKEKKITKIMYWMNFGLKTIFGLLFSYLMFSLFFF